MDPAARFQIKSKDALQKKSEPCIFPFRFNNITYHSCTWAYSDTAWCSTQVDSSGVHIGGSKGRCDNGCMVPPKAIDEQQMELPTKELYNVLEDIFFNDMSIIKSVVTSPHELEKICGISHEKEYAELRRRVTNSIAFFQCIYVCMRRCWQISHFPAFWDDHLQVSRDNECSNPDPHQIHQDS